MPESKDVGKENKKSKVSGEVQKPESPKPAKTEQKPAKTEQKPAKKTVTADRVEPLKPTADISGVPKRGIPRKPGDRGPDKMPRKRRLHVVEPGSPAEKPSVPPAGIERPSDYHDEAWALAAEETTAAFVSVASVLVAFYLPPDFTESEKKALIGAWLPVIRHYQDLLVVSPWYPALAVSVAVLLPRIALRLNARDAAREAEKPDGPRPA